MSSYKKLAIVGLVFGFLVMGGIRPLKIANGSEDSGVFTPEKLVVVGGGVKEAVDYYLPYPGMLPDSPFYWVKMIRDRVQLWLTTNPLQKTEKLLLYADKRLGAGYSLIDGDKAGLGVTTLTKAEKYLEQANVVANQLDGEEELKIKLNKATRKHREVLEMVKEKVGEEYKLVVEQMIGKILGGIHPLKIANDSEDSGVFTPEKLVEGLVNVTIKIDDGEAIVEFTDSESKTALELLNKGAEANDIEVIIKEYDFGSLVTAIGDKENSVEKAWIYYVNGESATVGADQYELKDGDVIEWKYEKPIF
ncbi:MAG: DUF5667 domain-containing protein [Candidatus Beckwithbacteria bacterium]